MGPSKITIAGLVMGLALFTGVAGCGGAHAETEHGEGEGGHHLADGQYPVTHPLRTSTEIEREYVAQIHAYQHIELRALERGYVEDIFVDEGQPVTAGTRMFQIMPMIYRAELAKAAAEADFAGIEFENTRTLHEGNVVSPNELKLAAARRDKADAELALAQAHFDLTQVKAPFDGIMGRLEVRKGSLVEEGELLTTMADNHKMWVYFNVTEAEYLDYKRRMDHHDPFDVRLRLANGEIFEEKGVVETIEADFNNETGNIAFRATFPNPTGLLRHGETGNVVVTTPLEDVLIIPQKATFDVLDKKFVFVVDAEGIAHLKEIHVAEELPHLYVVSSGLDEDDNVLLDGLRKVRDGHEVATIFEPPSEVMANLDLHAE